MVFWAMSHAIGEGREDNPFFLRRGLSRGARFDLEAFKDLLPSRTAELDSHYLGAFGAGIPSPPYQ